MIRSVVVVVLPHEQQFQTKEFPTQMKGKSEESIECDVLFQSQHGLAILEDRGLQGLVLDRCTARSMPRRTQQGV